MKSLALQAIVAVEYDLQLGILDLVILSDFFACRSTRPINAEVVYMILSIVNH